MPGTDILVTPSPGVTLVIMVADCVPLALVDPAAVVLAAVHAGGRGTAGGAVASSLHAMEVFRSPRWEDYDYEYHGEKDGVEGNRLKWFGNGWSSAQVDEAGGELAFYLQPEFVDIPASPYPEKTRVYQMRPFSY